MTYFNKPVPKCCLFCQNRGEVHWPEVNTHSGVYTFCGETAQEIKINKPEGVTK
jgi:hypothetical protein